ncbi:MAG TPA: SIS domain-containing protein [Acidimicrobiales bacterium]|nr:SIS domain-containing protein [Acidimicrobiales bacterium]
MTLPATPDTLGMWEATARLPEQVAAAALAGRAVPLAVEQPVSNVVALGVGGDGLAGDVLAAVAGGVMAVPLVVVKSAELPAFVGPDSLVFAVSCSGETESTLAAADRAWAAGAQVVAVSGPGRLARLAEREGSPVVPVPADVPQARAGLGALAVPALVVLERLGLLPEVGTGIDAAVDQLARRRDELVGPDNVALDVARRIGRTFPLVHGSPGLTGVAAQRWKTQVNENAKSPAFWSVHPDLCHNEVAGWGQSGDVTRQLLTLVELRHGAEDPAIARRFELAGEALAEVVADVVAVWAQGEGELARFFDLVLVGDFVSLHLAAREGVDPGPVPAVAEIERLVSG